MFLHFAQYYVREPGFHHMQGGERAGMLIAPLVFLLVIIIAMLLAYKAFTKHYSATIARDPLDIAKERYAKGEKIEPWVKVSDKFYDKSNAQASMADGY